MTPSIRQNGEAVSPRTSPMMTTPSKEQLMPLLPDRHGYQTIRLPSGDKAVITRVPRNRGTSEQPEYQDTFYLHTPEGATRYALGDIRRIQDTLEPWTPWPETEEGEKALQKAEKGKILWSEALNVISVDGSKDQADRKDRQPAGVMS